MKHKKMLLLCMAAFSAYMQTGWAQDMAWASKAVEYCQEKESSAVWKTEIWLWIIT